MCLQLYLVCEGERSSLYKAEINDKVQDITNLNLEFDTLISKAWNFLRGRNQHGSLLKSCSQPFKSATNILDEKLGPKWDGQTFSQLRKLGFLGFTHFYIEKRDHPEISVIKSLNSLDSKNEQSCVSNLISACWRKLGNSVNSKVLSFLYNICSDEKYVQANEVMRKELKDKWDGSTFDQLKKKKFSGFAHYFLSIMYPAMSSTTPNDIEFLSLLDLFQVDEKYGTSFDETISAGWKILLENESLLLSLLEKSNTPHAKATEILYRQSGREWDGKTDGYTSSYLDKSLISTKEQFSSSVDLSDVEKLIRLDFEKGKSLLEMVFTCCQACPKKAVIEKVMEIGKELLGLDESNHEAEKQLAKIIFYSRTQSGFNCLMVMFGIAVRHHNENHVYIGDRPMIHDIEESYFYLVDYAQSNNLDMMEILNQPTVDGTTFFEQATLFSEPIAKSLLDFGVNVNNVTAHFTTPSFRVSVEPFSNHPIVAKTREGQIFAKSG